MRIMEELKKFCKTCKEEKDIVEIERDEQKEAIKLSCGHKIFSIEFTEIVTHNEQLKFKHKRPGFKKPIGEGTEREKISGDTKRPAKESIRIDRIKQTYSHKVWEKNEKGELKLVHDEEIPLSEKGKS